MTQLTDFGIAKLIKEYQESGYAGSFTDYMNNRNDPGPSALTLGIPGSTIPFLNSGDSVQKPDSSLAALSSNDPSIIGSIEMQSEPTPYSAVDESVNPITKVQQSNNATSVSQPFIPTEIVQSHPKPRIDKPQKSIYESLRERRTTRQPEPRKAPQPSEIKTASSPLRARRSMAKPSSMKDLALQKMRADKQTTDTAQSKTDSIQAAIKKLRGN